ncbi:MAG: hypothetical protein AB8G14_15905 [Ilumatobacter sp.]
MNTSSSGLVFLDRLTGEVAEFGEEFGRISSLGVRRPDTELVDAAQTARDDISLSTPLTGESGLELVAIGQVGTTAYVDVDDLAATTWSTPAAAGARGVDIFPIDGRMVVLDTSGADSYATGFESWEPIEFGPNGPPTGQRLPGPQGDLVWIPVPDGDDGVDRTTHTLDGSVAQNPRRMVVRDGLLLGGDGNGELVIDAWPAAGVVSQR